MHREMYVRFLLLVCTLYLTCALGDDSSIQPVKSADKREGRHWPHLPLNRAPLLNFNSIANYNDDRFDPRDPWSIPNGDWQSPGYQGLPSLSSQGKCVQIPDRMILCRDIGYDKMLLPNFLDHYTVSEAVHQSNSWIGVRSANCHKDIRTFLCSLYAPLCIEGQGLRPCRSMCQSVREACEPSLKRLNHSWPEMFDCNQFPVDDQLCLRTQVDKLCHACKPATSLERALDMFCEADFVLRVTVEESLATEDHLRVTVAGKVKILKFRPRGAWNRRKYLSNRTFHVEGGFNCDCPQLETINGVRDNGSLVFLGSFPAGTNSTAAVVGGDGNEEEEDDDDDGVVASGGKDSKSSSSSSSRKRRRRMRGREEKLFVTEVHALTRNLRRVFQGASEFGSDDICRDRSKLMKLATSKDQEPEAGGSSSKRRKMKEKEINKMEKSQNIRGGGTKKKKKQKLLSSSSSSSSPLQRKKKNYKKNKQILARI